MPKITTHAPGTFCWADLATNDAQAAKTFYNSLFGWTFTDMPISEGMTYTMFHLNGADVAALAENTEQPPHWNPYVSVESADDTASQAQSLGAQVIFEPFDVMDKGRMAVMQDPAGAFLCVWQSKSHHGAGLMGEPGTLSWTELATHDAAKSSEFYTKLFHWKSVSNEVNDTTYTVFMNDDKMVAGMFPIGEEWKEIPSHWSVFFAVTSCKESLEKAVSLGAQVIVEPTPVENFGCFAVLQDPQGAPFGIVAMREDCGGLEQEGRCC